MTDNIRPLEFKTVCHEVIYAEAAGITYRIGKEYKRWRLNADDGKSRVYIDDFDSVEQAKEQANKMHMARIETWLL